MISQSYENESNVLKICCKAAPKTPECPTFVAKKSYLSYKEKPLTNELAKELASWIDNAYQGLRFQYSAKFTAMIMGSAKKTLQPVSEAASTSTNDVNKGPATVPHAAPAEQAVRAEQGPTRDRTMFIISNDKKMVLCTVKCSSIGMLSGPRSTTGFPNEVGPSNKRRFVWSDFLARETGSAFQSLKATLSVSEADLAKPFLKPEVHLREAMDYDMFVGLFRKKLGYEHIVNIKIGSDVSEFLAFNETDITWKIQTMGEIVGEDQSESFTDFANKSMNFLKTGQHFAAENAVRLETDELFDASGCAICKKTENLKQCARCQKVQYCGPVCQRQHWVIHKPSCIPK